MQENTEQRLDKLARKVLGQVELESPKSDFTANVMAHIEQLDTQKSKGYQPLISRRVWFIVGIIITGIIIYMYFGNTQSLGWFEGLDISFFDNFQLAELLSGITISNTTMYVAIFFGALLFVQINLLKNYFNKRLQF